MGMRISLNILQVLSICGTVLSTVTGPVSIHKYVREDAKFTWSTTDNTAFNLIEFGAYASNAGVPNNGKLFNGRFNQQPPVSSSLNTTDPYYKGRLYFYGDLNAGRATFEIRNITVADENEYTVKIAEKPRTVYNVFMKGTLKVRVAPAFTSPLSSQHDIEENKTLNVACSVSGRPPPNVTWIWKTGGRQVAFGTGSATLDIPGIKRDNNGTYECQAINDPAKEPIKYQTTVNVQYPPVIAPMQIITVREGEKITLPCSATGNPTPSRSWSRPGSPTIKPGSTPNSQDTLEIEVAGKSDAGEYICTAINVVGGNRRALKASAFVAVKYPPSILNNSADQTINETDSLRLLCTADGYPAPTFTWSKGGGEIGPGPFTNVYRIARAMRSEAGIYTCTATNEINRATASIQVTVNYKPEIDVGSSTTNVSSWNGKDIRLQCKASGVPSPQFTWYMPNGQPITAGVSSISGGSQLRKKTIQDGGDYGQYKCRASNLLGPADHLINVTQLFPPDPPVVTVTDIEASSITVRWSSPVSDGGSAVIEYKVEVSTKPLRQGITGNSVVISDLTKNTEYLVKVSAKNVVGYGSAGTNTIRTKKQGAPSLPIIETSSNEITDLQVLLKWNKPDENGGTIQKYTIYYKVTFPSVDATEWQKRHTITDTTVLQYTVEGLKAKMTYSFLVTATNQFGESKKDYSKARVVRITTKPITKEPGGGEESSDKESSSTPVIAGAAAGGAILVLVLVAVLFVLMRKKRLQRQGHDKGDRRRPPDEFDSYDNADHNTAAFNLGNGGEGDIPTYAAVDMSKKKKNRKNEPTYAEVDKSKKKKPGEIVYAELADFNAIGEERPVSRPPAYQETQYADINQFQQEPTAPEPMYGNISGRGDATYDNVQNM